MECSICLEDIKKPMEQTGMIKECFHLFHFQCLWDWLSLTETCPLCREIAKPNPTYMKSLPFGYIMSKDSFKQSVRCGTQHELLNREVTRVLYSARSQRRSRETPSAVLSLPSLRSGTEGGNTFTSPDVILPGQAIDIEANGSRTKKKHRLQDSSRDKQIMMVG